MGAKRKTAREAALSMLSCRAYAEGALFGRLIEKGYTEDEASETVGWLTELGYLDDAAYAESVIRGQRAKGYGPRRILAYLREKGVSRETAEAALESASGGDGADGDPAEAIDAFLRKRAPDRPDGAARQKLAAALARRGFDYSDIRAGLERLEE